MNLKKLRFTYQNRLTAYALGELPACSIYDVCGRGHPDRFYSQKTLHFTAITGATHRSNLSAVKLMRIKRPDIAFVCWDANAVHRFLISQYPDYYTSLVLEKLPGIMHSDLFRCAVLAKYGGYYFDLKSGFLGDLPCLNGHNAVLINEKPGTSIFYPQLFANWFLAGAPGEFFEELHDVLFIKALKAVRNKHEDFSNFVKRCTGPVAVTEFMKSTAEKRAWSIKVLDYSSNKEGLYYQCKRSWVRTLIHTHYSSRK